MSQQIEEPTETDSFSGVWKILGKKIPREEIVYFCQIFIIFVVVAVSLFNISRGHSSESLWVSLLSSCLGYVLPSPKLNNKKHSVNVHE